MACLRKSSVNAKNRVPEPVSTPRCSKTTTENDNYSNKCDEGSWDYAAEEISPNCNASADEKSEY